MQISVTSITHAQADFQTFYGTLTIGDATFEWGLRLEGIEIDGLEEYLQLSAEVRTPIGRVRARVLIRIQQEKVIPVTDSEYNFFASILSTLAINLRHKMLNNPMPTQPLLEAATTDYIEVDPEIIGLLQDPKFGCRF